MDGQQRTAAIVDYYRDELPLSSTFEVEAHRGHTYSELSEELQEAFLNYPLPIDLFTEVSQSEIFEVFRRMNSNAVTLTPEEIRHAQFQGKFKWFVYRQGREFEAILASLGTFGPRQFIKMLDLRWITELLDSFEDGIRTTKGADLKAIYQRFDEAYAGEKQHAQYLSHIRGRLKGLDQLAGTAIVRPHVLMSIAQAVVHLKYKLPVFTGLFATKGGKEIDLAKKLVELSEIAEAIEEKKVRSEHKAIVNASLEGTNVKAAREVRFKTFCELFAK